MLDNNKSKIEDIKRRLYDVDESVTHRPHEGTLHSVDYKAPEAWEEDKEMEDKDIMKKPKKHTKFFKNFFILAIIFFIGAISYAFYMFMKGGVSVSGDNIDITVFGNAFTKGGDELPLQIEITNRNNANLELANLIIEYPRGASDEATEMIRIPRDPIGTIKPGESVIRNIKTKLFGDEKSIRNVKIILEYHPEGSNAIFTKEKDYGVTISSAPLSLVVSAPDTTATDQLISFKVTASLNTSLPEGNTILQVKYPNGFEFVSATPLPSLNNSVWDLATLSLSNPIAIEIKGKLRGQEGDKQVFHVYAGSPSSVNPSTVDIIYNSLLHNVDINKPFLEAKILVNGEDTTNPSISSNEKVNGQISWVNNLSTRITDAQIILNLSGNALDRTSISSSDGFYDSLNNRIIWDKNTMPDLTSIDPGENGVVDFSLKPIAISGGASVIKDPEINLSVSIKGTQPSFGLNYGEVNNFVEKVIKISSNFQISSSATYYTGSLPPKAETETKYIVSWNLFNSVNSINQAKATASLPVYVKWIGPTVLNGSNNENISYNEATREVTWSIGSVKPKTGFGSNRIASFVLSITPSVSQVGSIPQLVKEISLSGIDDYTGDTVRSSYGYITTSTGSDSGKVVN